MTRRLSARASYTSHDLDWLNEPLTSLSGSMSRGGGAGPLEQYTLKTCICVGKCLEPIQRNVMG